MFVDSMGIKATVKDRIELATLLADGKARIITNNRHSFVQRALEAVRRMLNGDEMATTDKDFPGVIQDERTKKHTR